MKNVGLVLPCILKLRYRNEGRLFSRGLIGKFANETHSDFERPPEALAQSLNAPLENAGLLRFQEKRNYRKQSLDYIPCHRMSSPQNTRFPASC